MESFERKSMVFTIRHRIKRYPSLIVAVTGILGDRRAGGWKRAGRGKGLDGFWPVGIDRSVPSM
jgi:hypothetical protein